MDIWRKDNNLHDFVYIIANSSVICSYVFPGKKKRATKKKGKDSPPKSQIKPIKSEENLLIPQNYEIKSEPKCEPSGEEDGDDNVQEPEAGLEPAGPDQSLPVSTEPNPPVERKATSYINVSYFTQSVTFLFSFNAFLVL